MNVLRRAPRYAFTLLELLLAAGLSTLVLASLMTAINFVAQTEAASADRVELIRVATSLLDQLERDVGSVVVITSTTESSSSTERLVDADDAPDAESAETTSVFVGDLDFLLVATEPAETLSEVQNHLTGLLEYGEEPDGGLGARRREVLWQASPDEAAYDQTVREVSSSDPAYFGEGGSLTSALFVPEVASLEFAYLFEGEWAESWDDTEASGLPAAIRVNVAVQTVSTDGERGGEPLLMSRVIAIPAARYTASEEDDG